MLSEGEIHEIIRRSAAHTSRGLSNSFLVIEHAPGFEQSTLASTLIHVG